MLILVERFNFRLLEYFLRLGLTDQSEACDCSLEQEERLLDFIVAPDVDFSVRVTSDEVGQGVDKSKRGDWMLASTEYLLLLASINFQLIILSFKVEFKPLLLRSD